MTPEEIRSVLNRIAAADNDMSAAVIKGQFENCISSLRDATQMQDQPEAVRLSPAPYGLVAGQESLEKAVRHLDQGNKDGMLQAVNEALAVLPRT